MKVHNIEDMTPASPPDGSHHNDIDEDPQHSYSPSDIGCVHATLSYTANAIHCLQCISGIAVFSYAMAVSFHKPDPQHGIAILLELYSLCALIAGGAGICGIYRTNCKRLPLKMSLWTAPILGLSYFILAFILLVENKSIKNYLKEKEGQLFLSDKEIDFIVSSYYILLVLSIVEGLRFIILKKLKSDLWEYDQDQRRIMLENHARSSAAARRSWEANPQSDGAAGLTAPLLFNQGDDEENSSSQRQQSSLQNKSSASWWEEPEEEESSTLDTSNNSGGGGWMSKVFNSATSPSNNSIVSDGEPKDRSGASVSSAGFASLNDEVETGSTTPWHDPPVNDDNGGPDLSWVNEETDL